MFFKQVFAFLTRVALYATFSWAIWLALSSIFGWIAIILSLVAMIPTRDTSNLSCIQAIIEVVIAIAGIIAAFFAWGTISGIALILIYLAIMIFDLKDH